MSNRNKLRLYLAFYYRSARSSGHHWALVVAPKEETSGEEEGVFKFHATNTLQLGHLPGPGGSLPWRYEMSASDPAASTRLVARVLVAKIRADESIQQVAAVVDSVVRQVPIMQDDPGWNCRTWVVEALALLRARGGDFSTIPQLALGTELESSIVAFADKGTKWRFGQEHSGVMRIPVLDIRQ